MHFNTFSVIIICLSKQPKRWLWLNVGWGRGTHGREYARTWDSGTRELGDLGTRGPGDAGTRGHGDPVTRWRGDAGTRASSFQLLKLEKLNCNVHSSPSSTTAVRIELFHISFTSKCKLVIYQLWYYYFGCEITSTLSVFARFYLKLLFVSRKDTCVWVLRSST